MNPLIKLYLTHLTLSNRYNELLKSGSRNSSTELAIELKDFTAENAEELLKVSSITQEELDNLPSTPEFVAQTLPDKNGYKRIFYTYDNNNLLVVTNRQS